MKDSINNKKMRKRNEQCITEQRQGMARPFLILAFAFLISHFSFLICNAQTFTQRIQKSSAGEGTITIHQDPAIDELVNAPIATSKPKANANKPTKPTKPTGTKNTENKAKPTVTQKAKETPAATPAPDNSTNKNSITESSKDPIPDTLNTRPKHVYKTIGYRVQVLAGGNKRQDRQRAEQAGRSLRSLFPDEEVYVHFYSPRWICRLGNYRTYEEAHAKMLEVRNLGYSSATIVKGKITVSE